MCLIGNPTSGFFWDLKKEFLGEIPINIVDQYFMRKPAYSDTIDRIIDDIYNNSDLTKEEIFSRIVELVSSGKLNFHFVKTEKKPDEDDGLVFVV